MAHDPDWTYTPGSEKLKDEIRFLCGDTNTARKLLLDGEITTAIRLGGNNKFRSAAYACDAIAGKFARDSTFTVQGTTAERRDAYDHYKELAQEEIKELEEQKEQLITKIKDTLVMSDDTAIDSIIMEIRPGTGGDEAALFVRDLYGMYTRYAETKKYKVETLSVSPTEMGGFKEVIINVKGSGVWADLGYEGGGHRVQRVPETETQGRVHTSAATVAVLPEPEEVDVHVDPSDVLEHVSRAGGPGGQSVNKLNSAIKL
ncbi:hypothetical protein LCGC14_3157720, partial [marine sediment metagenome]